MQVERPCVERLADLHFFDPGTIARPVEPDLETTGMVLSNQGATHTTLETTPFTLAVCHTACAKLCPDLRMAVADRDLLPLSRHLEALAERDEVHGYEQSGDQQQRPTEDSQYSVCGLSVHGRRIKRANPVFRTTRFCCARQPQSNPNIRIQQLPSNPTMDDRHWSHPRHSATPGRRGRFCVVPAPGRGYPERLNRFHGQIVSLARSTLNDLASQACPSRNKPAATTPATGSRFTPGWSLPGQVSMLDFGPCSSTGLARFLRIRMLSASTAKEKAIAK